MVAFLLELVCTISFSFISVYTSSFCTGSLLVRTSSVYQYIGLVQFEDSISWYYTVQYSFALDPIPVYTVARLASLVELQSALSLSPKTFQTKNQLQK